MRFVVSYRGKYTERHKVSHILSISILFNYYDKPVRKVLYVVENKQTVVYLLGCFVLLPDSERLCPLISIANDLMRFCVHSS